MVNNLSKLKCSFWKYQFSYEDLHNLLIELKKILKILQISKYF